MIPTPQRSMPWQPEHRADWVRLDGPGIEAGAQPQLLLLLEAAVQLRGHDHRCGLAPGSVLACDGRDPPLQLRAELGRPARAFVLWPDARHLVGAPRGGRPRLLSMVHAPGSAVAEAMATLAAGLAPEEGPAALHRGLSAVLAAQDAACEAYVARCSGRTSTRRRELFVRLWRARVLLEAEAGEPADVADLAAVASLSPSHFVRLFHRVFGEPPHQFRKRRRLERAWRLACHSDMPIHEIMWRAGYDSHPCFARAFRNHFGTSATAARAAARGRGNPGHADRASMPAAPAVSAPWRRHGHS